MESVDLSSFTGTFITDFGGEADVLDQINAPTIYGRTKEKLLLLDIYDAIRRTRKSQTVLVHGLSGYGKTAFIESFRESVCESGGLFCSGKYFQNSGVQEPHSAIMAAFSDLCDLVIQSDDFTQNRKQQIRRDLGSEAHLLKKVISNISPLLGGSQKQDTTGINDLNSDAAMTLFRVACKSFLRAMSSWKEPVVVFLDDIQWMDEGSRKLMEMYLSDTELSNVMFILAYRDEDEEDVSKLLADVSRNRVVDIPIGKMTPQDVSDLVVGILQRLDNSLNDDSMQMDEKTKALVNLVYQRTSGNPFHVVQFMDAIQLEGLLTFESSWEFNVDEIQREVMVAKSVADLLLRKIQHLPESEQETMKVASLMGYEFDESVLFEIVREERRRCDESVSTSTRALSLVMAHQMGLVEKIGDTCCHFPHDKIQSAFRSMIDEDEELHLHRVIGEKYLMQDSDDSIYHAAVHLNQAIAVFQEDVNDQRRLAKLNLEASQYARDRSAFEVAAGLLRQGLGVLGSNEERWSKDFTLVFEMTENLAKVELTLGNLESCKQCTQETLSRATSLDMKIDSLLVAAECQMTSNEVESTIDIAVGALKLLGMRMPRRVRFHHMIRKFLRVRRRLRGLEDEAILQLPPMEDRAVTAASKILIDLCLYGLLQDQDFLAVYSALVAIELTLQHGLAPHAPTYILVYSTVELMSRNFTRTERFANLGIKLLEQMQSTVTECSALFTWVSILGHWKEPLRDLRGPITKAVDSGFQTGDVVFTPIAMANLFGISFLLGDNLQDLAQYMRQRYHQLYDLSQDAMLLWLQPCFQAVLNLQSEASDWTELAHLSGEIMNEEEFYRQALQARNPIVVTIAGSFKALLAYHFGSIEESVKTYQEMANVPLPFFNTAAAPSWYLFGSLTFYENYRRTGKRKHLRQARKWKRCLEQFQARGCPNVSFVSLLQAEEKSLQKRLTVGLTTSLFDTAIGDMADEKLVQLEALANERAGFVLAKQGARTEAKPYFARAMDLYGNEWGATAKYEWLQEKCVQYVATSDGTNLQAQQVIGEILVVGEGKD